MLITLDVDCVFYPAPRNGPNWRPKAIAEGGKTMFPYLKDPNTGTVRPRAAPPPSQPRATTRGPLPPVLPA